MLLLSVVFNLQDSEIVPSRSCISGNTVSAAGPGNGNLMEMALGGLLFLKTRGFKPGQEGPFHLNLQGHAAE